MITIDETKCSGCAWCVDECPARIYHLEKGVNGNKRTVMAEFSDSCNRCGHCVALCPEDAIIHRELPGNFAPIITPNAIDPDLMSHFLQSRRSTRAFKKKSVPRELIELLLDAGTHAGSATNAQTEGFVVIEDPERLLELENMVIELLWKKVKILGNPLGRALAGLKYGKVMADNALRYYERFKTMRDKGEIEGSVFRGAPAVIAIEGDRSNRSVHENAAIAARNMELLAMTYGLGTCWAGFLLIAAQETDKIAQYMGLPLDRNIFSAIMVGYPSHTYRKLVPREKRTTRWL